MRKENKSVEKISIIDEPDYIVHSEMLSHPRLSSFGISIMSNIFAKCSLPSKPLSHKRLSSTEGEYLYSIRYGKW
jgi:hypothetical protein